jgi:nitrogen fixation/metabolism regulation signal transduction histidine kinase
VRPLRFRSRLFAILTLFAVVPAMVLTLAWGLTVREALPLVSGSAAWERVAGTGRRAIAAANAAPLSAEQRTALQAHEQELARSLEQARRWEYVAARAVRVIAVAGVLWLALLAVLASRVAGHLSRQLSRPLDELVGWAERIARGDPLPEGPARRGAPEFEVLRQRLRRTARELELGRQRALEAERLSAFRETARQVAHELKNPLTPIRFAIARIRNAVLPAQPELAEPVEVLTVETERIDRLARSFAQFGRLPEGTMSEVDMGELARYTARATVPAHVPLVVEVEEPLPLVRGHHDALARALSNVLLNAVDACADRAANAAGVPAITVRVGRVALGAEEAVEISVRDTGCGIATSQLERIWEPYVTTKAGGTGLGLAIARQTVLAHDGEVEAESAPGSGTEIRFRLPVARPIIEREVPA